MDDIFVEDGNIDGLMQMVGTLGKITSNVMRDYEEGEKIDDQAKVGLLMGFLTVSTALCLLVRSQEYHYRESEQRFNVN